MSSVVSGDKPRAKSVVSTASGTTNVTAGAPVTNLGANVKSKKTITDRVPAYTTPKNVPRTYVSAAPKTFKTIFGGRGVVPLAAVNRFPTRFAPKATVVAKPVVKPTAKKPATVVSNVTNEKLTPTKTAPATKAVSMRTGDTTGVTTGKTTGTVSRTPGMATKTKQSAYGRQMANAARNQPAGPMGGGGGRMGSGTGPSRSGGGGNLGGARGRISEPGGSKR
jgi:hypothetical protein